MLHTTRAVVLRTFRHSDNTVVLKAYTEAFGARSYMVRTGKRGGARPAHLQPLDRVELVVSENRDRDLHTAREIRSLKPYVGIPADPARGLVLLFVQEVLYRALREGPPDPGLFTFILGLLEDIDTGADPASLPLLAMVGLARHLGILPQPPRTGEDRFDLREGHFFRGEAPHAFCLDPDHAAALALLLHAEEEGTGALPPPSRRKVLLEQLLIYFRLHVDGFGELRSPAVLHELIH